MRQNGNATAGANPANGIFQCCPLMGYITGLSLDEIFLEYGAQVFNVAVFHQEARKCMRPINDLLLASA